jgi:hypothetical protein
VSGEVVEMIDAVVGMLQIVEVVGKMANVVVIRIVVPGRTAVMYVGQFVELQIVIEGSPARGGVLSIGLGYVRRNLAGTGGGN